MNFSWHRLFSIVRKEFIQIRRDRVTFAMMIGIPIIQLVLFGFAINSDPKHLPTAVVSGDSSSITRRIVAAMETSRYYRITVPHASVQQARRLLKNGQVQFVLRFPEDFTVRLVRGEHPPLLLEADATDPVATGTALAAFPEIINTALRDEMTGVLAVAGTVPPPVDVRVHKHYNPEGITQYNVVPGIMGVILTMTMIMMTALGVTREAERGTMENLLSMPVMPLEVMIGKIVPYIMVAYVQVTVILLACRYVFDVPMTGDILLLLVEILFFVFANLTVGIVFSSIARNQLQAIQMTFFFFLPSILLSGFMFPFRGMPGWAQALGEVLPLTHFLRIARGILLKTWSVQNSLHDVAAMVIFTIAVMIIGLLRFRRTLD